MTDTGRVEGKEGRRKAADRGNLTHESTARAVIIVPVLTRQPRASADDALARGRTARSAPARLEEAIGLAGAIDLDTVHSSIVTINDPRPATLLGTGKLEEFAEIVKETKLTWYLSIIR